MQIQDLADRVTLLSSSARPYTHLSLYPLFRTAGSRCQAILMSCILAVAALFAGCAKTPATTTSPSSESQLSCGADAGCTHCGADCASCCGAATGCSAGNCCAKAPGETGGPGEEGTTCQDVKCSGTEGKGKCPNHTCKHKDAATCSRHLTKEEIQKRLSDASVVSEHHKILKDFVGTWNAKVTIFSGEGQTSLTSTATSVVKPILGGRFVEETYKGKHQGKPFEGRGLTGYDNVAQMYVSTWADTMGTAIMMSKGHYDEKAKTFIFEGDYLCPVTRKTKKSRSQLRLESPDRHVYEMYDTLPNGQENKTMEVVYTRKSK